MVLGALLTFCICKRRKQNRRRKGKTPSPPTPHVYSEIPGNVSPGVCKGKKESEGQGRGQRLRLALLRAQVDF